MEALRYEVTCPKSHSWQAETSAFEPRPAPVQHTLPFSWLRPMQAEQGGLETGGLQRAPEDTLVRLPSCCCEANLAPALPPHPLPLARLGSAAQLLAGAGPTQPWGSGLGGLSWQARVTGG